MTHPHPASGLRCDLERIRAIGRDNSWRPTGGRVSLLGLGRPDLGGKQREEPERQGLLAGGTVSHESEGGEERAV